MKQLFKVSKYCDKHSPKKSFGLYAFNDDSIVSEDSDLWSKKKILWKELPVIKVEIFENKIFYLY